ncbi:colicin V production CvpA [Dehalococcoides mccartyi]|jgi:membrane protein required for colicin V production|uniref:CvpA family protein n=1 Tax=Dehalococcoides mccartyi TaxID=61435 RepID=UPI0004E03DAB|nr:CvpA family protein [Dehalococcoides mccartyi]AII57447.1 colicin V production CvpA [Dehalococcoides mccartyi CG1]APH11944.1 colicin V production CvpA [Dehalococcoides mccartyi]
MNWLDIVLLIALGAQTVSGFFTGLILNFLHLVGLIIGIILAGRFYPTVAEWLSFISSPEWANIIAFLLVLMAIWVTTTIIAKLLDTIIKPTFLNWVNRLGGAIFGLLVSSIFTAALLAIWVKFFGSASVITDSAVAQILLDKFPLILSLLPDEFGVIRDFFN